MFGVDGLDAYPDPPRLRETRTSAAWIGAALLAKLQNETDRRLLIGTWQAAEWAIRFYEPNGFRVAAEEERDRLLAAYRTIPPRQRQTSVVLARAST